MATTYLHYKYENTIQISKGSILVYEKYDNSVPFFQGNWRPTRSKPAVVKTFNCDEMSDKQSDLVVSSQERSEILQLFQGVNNLWWCIKVLWEDTQVLEPRESFSLGVFEAPVHKNQESTTSPQHLDVLQLAHVDPRLMYKTITLCW